MTDTHVKQAPWYPSVGLAVLKNQPIVSSKDPMDRVAVFVDAGYLFAAGSIVLTGADTPVPRVELKLDEAAAVQALIEFATAAADLPLLRIYWYDGAWGGPTKQQVALACVPNVKLRLGTVNLRAEQKGVDSLIVTDLINLARNGATAAAVLVGGDEDLRVGMQQAQEFGVRVHLLGIKPITGKNQSAYLVQEADMSDVWDKVDVEKFLSVRTVHESADPFQVAAEAIASQLSQEEISTVANGSRWSSEIDARLLVAGSRVLARPMSADERERLRTVFKVACRSQIVKRETSLPVDVFKIVAETPDRPFEEFDDDSKQAAELALTAMEAYHAGIRIFESKYERPTPDEDPEDRYSDEVLEAGREAYLAYIAKHGSERQQ